MIEPDYQSEDGSITLYRGESLDVLRQLPAGIVDAVITDPPYSSGGMYRGDRNQTVEQKYCQSDDLIGRATFSGDNRDGRSFALWCSLWLDQCRRMSRPGAYCHVFCDWRQVPTTTDIMQAGGYVWRGLIAWDKGRGARAPHKGYHRHQAEYVVWGTNGACPKATHAGPHDGVYRYPVKQKDKHHVCGKPTPLMRDLVQIVPEGATVLDPFMGSGTTAVAAALEGRRCIGIEMDAGYFDIAVDRIEKALFDRKAQQEAEAEAQAVA